MSLYNLVFGLFFCGFITRRIGGRMAAAFLPMLSAFAYGILALSATSLLTYLAPIDSSSVWQAAILVFVYIGIYLGMTRLFLKDSLAEVVSLAIRGISGFGRANRSIG
jgi:hypothetical protein